jgi:drug/metabolite transporter (DMT)-like permease
LAEAALEAQPLFFWWQKRKRMMAGREFVLFAVLGITWGSLWLLTGGAPDPLPLLCAGAIEFAVAALLLFAYGVARRGKTGLGTRYSFGSGVAMGMMLLAIPYACTAWASGWVHPNLRAAAAGLPAIIYAALPLAVMLMTGADAVQYLPKLLSGLTGIALLVWQGAALDLARWLSELLLMGGMLGYGFALVYGMRRMHDDEGQVGTTRFVDWCSLQYASAAVMLALLALANGDWIRLGLNVSSVDPGRWFGVVLAGGISAVTLPILYVVLKALGPIPVAAMQWLISLTGLLEAAFFLPVMWTWQNWLGLGMTLGALGWALSDEQNPGNA